MTASVGAERDGARPVGLAGLLARVLTTRTAHRRADIFRDTTISEDLARDGYHVTAPVVAPSVIEDLLAAAAAWERAAGEATDGPGRFRFSRAVAGDPVGAEARAAITDLLVPEVERLVRPGRALVGPSVFQVKPSSPASGIRSHQDGFVVDERRSFSVSAWTALTPVTIEDGPLIVLPGSHRFARWRRCSTTHDDLAGYHEAIERWSHVVLLEPGQVLLFDAALIHGSLVNTSGRRRIGASALIVPAGVDVTAPEAHDEAQPASARLFRIDPPLAVGRAVPDRRDTELVGRSRLSRLGAPPHHLEWACRADAALRGRGRARRPVPSDRSTA